MDIPQNMSGGLRTNGIIKSSSTDYPLVSIITVVFNGERYLEQTILSVINQKYRNFEYIIIDGLSSDKTRDIIRKYENKIDYWISESDAGIYDAMNKGIALSNGELIGIINSDDWYEEVAVAEVVEKYKCNLDINIFHGLHRLWDDRGVLGVIGHTDLFLNNGMISHPSCFIKRSIYEKYGNYSCEYKIVSDYELMLRFKSKEVSFMFIEKILANFRNNGISFRSKRQLIFETMQIQKKYALISVFQLHLYKVGYYFRSVFLSE